MALVFLAQINITFQILDTNVFKTNVSSQSSSARMELVGSVLRNGSKVDKTQVNARMNTLVMNTSISQTILLSVLRTSAQITKG